MTMPQTQSDIYGRSVGFHRQIPGIPTTGITPPNLTDTSFQGLYAATTRVPSVLARGANRISAIIGAPALAGGPAPTVVTQPMGGGGAVRPIRAAVPEVVWRAWSRSKLFASNLIRR